MASEVKDFYIDMMDKVFKRVPTPSYIKDVHKRTVGGLGGAIVGKRKRRKKRRR